MNLLFNGVTVMGTDGVETQVYAAVTELRADWKFYRETLRRYQMVPRISIISLLI